MSALDHTGSRYGSVAKTRSDYGDDDLAERDQLLQCLAALQDEERRIVTLETAREKARRESWAVSAKMRDAEDKLRQAEADEPQRRVYAFVNSANGGNGSTEISPVEGARAALDAAQLEDRQVLRLESDLDREIAQAATQRNRAQSQVHAALSALVCASPQFHQLLDELTRSYARIRGLRKCLAAIQHQLGGHMPTEYERRWQSVPSLDPTATHVPGDRGPVRIPTDDGPVTAWREALDNLLEDPDAELPNQG